jgi:nucleotide-binding universal stress UspA family protein
MTELILETILVAVDFSEQSNAALEQAIHAATHQGSAKLVLLWVGGQPAAGPVGAELYSAGKGSHELAPDARSEARAKLEMLADRARAQGVPAEVRIGSGYADEVIVRIGGEIGAALIVIGTRGLTGLKRFLLGSVAEKVVRTSTTNVLVARGEVGVYQRVLVATDFSTASERALQVAVAMAPPNAHIDVLHAWQYPPGAHGLKDPDSDTGPLADLRDDIVRRVEKLGNALVARYKSSTRTVAFSCAYGSAREVVHDRLEAETYDLVAMGTHGYRGFRRFLLGSVAEATVRHAPCSVLIAHPHHDESEE